MFLPFLSAILGIIAFLPVNFYPASFVFLAPLFVFFAREQKFWRLIFGALIFRLIFFFGTIYFTLEPLAWSSGLLIFLGLPISVWLVRKLTKQPYAILILLPFLWTFFDHLEAQYSLLPSYAITAGNSLGSSPFIGLAGLGGLTVLTFFATLINALIVAIVVTGGNDKNKINFAIGAIIFILLFSGWQISNFELRKNSIAYDNLQNSIKIAAISTNEKFDRGQFKKLKTELSGKQFDLIVFPEDIFSARIFSSDNQLEFFQNLAKELNTNITTVFDTIRDGKKYNSAILFDNQGNIAGVHNKNRLTFIGEYWPFGNWRLSFYDWVKKTNPAIENYAVFNPQNAYVRGDRKNLSINIQGNEVLFATLVCLEIHYPSDLEEYKNSGARFIVNESSNRWIKEGVRHFLYLADNLKKIEAVWLKIPIVSNGVNSYAGVILPNGETRLVDYENGDKNYGIFWGEIRY